MRLFQFALVIGFTTLLPLGCSSETRRETGEALRETGEAVESAAKDAANVTEGAIEGASQAIEENKDEADLENDVELERE